MNHETIWLSRQPLAGTPAAKYLGLTARAAATHSKTLGFTVFDYFDLPDIPCIIAAIRSPEGALTGIQRTFLRPGTSDAIMQPCPCMACAGEPIRYLEGEMGYGAIRLGEPADILGLAATLEEALALSKRYAIPVWSTVGAGRMQRVEAPESVNHLILFMSPRLVESGWAKSVETEQKKYVERVSTVIIE